jgi:hypothetical protein
MILYVNGDSHTAAAEAVNPHAFAEDDSQYFYMGRAPHPDNLSASWGRILSSVLKAILHCDAESAASNDRILRTTRAWLDNNKKEWYRTLVIIQWSTWEREEWLHKDTYYQVNGSGIDQVPQELQEKYRQYILGIDWGTKTQQSHDKIWAFHQELDQQGIKHLFFNGNNSFDQIVDQQCWNNSYIHPYDQSQTYHALLQSSGFETVSPQSWHYGSDAHSWWSTQLLNYIVKNKLA